MTMMTEATPMTTPMRVRMERSLLPQRDWNASLKASISFMQCSQCTHRSNGSWASCDGCAATVGEIGSGFSTERGATWFQWDGAGRGGGGQKRRIAGDSGKKKKGVLFSARIPSADGTPGPALVAGDLGYDWAGSAVRPGQVWLGECAGGLVADRGDEETRSLGLRFVPSSVSAPTLKAPTRPANSLASCESSSLATTDCCELSAVCSMIEAISPIVLTTD